MKIRIKGNSIRIRLTKPEIDAFSERGYLEEKTDFGKNSFSYVVCATEKGEALSAEFSDGAIRVFIPVHLAKEWTATDRVGYESEMEVGHGKKLILLLEKDFKCLDNITEDQSGQYENPLAVKGQQ